MKRQEGPDPSGALDFAELRLGLAERLGPSAQTSCEMARGAQSVKVTWPAADDPNYLDDPDCSARTVTVTIGDDVLASSYGQFVRIGREEGGQGPDQDAVFYLLVNRLIEALDFYACEEEGALLELQGDGAFRSARDAAAWLTGR